jgi:hypothetical protein
MQCWMKNRSKFVPVLFYQKWLTHQDVCCIIDLSIERIKE